MIHTAEANKLLTEGTILEFSFCTFRSSGLEKKNSFFRPMGEAKKPGLIVLLISSLFITKVQPVYHGL